MAIVLTAVIAFILGAAAMFAFLYYGSAPVPYSNNKPVK